MGDPVGPVANFLAGISSYLHIMLIKEDMLLNKAMITALVMATLVMTIVLSILNYFVLLPLYGMIFNLADIVKI